MSFGEKFRNFVGGVAMMTAAAGVAEARNKHTPDLPDNAGIEQRDQSKIEFINSVIDQATKGYKIKDPEIIERAKKLMEKNVTEEDISSGTFGVSAYAESLQKTLIERHAVEKEITYEQPTPEQIQKVIENAPRLEGEPNLDMTKQDGNILVGDGFIAIKLENIRNVSLNRSIASKRLNDYAQAHNLTLGLNNSIMIKNGEQYMYVATR